MKISKTEIIQKLYEIAEKQKMNLDKEVQSVIRNEIVPMDVIKLINRYDKQFLQIYNTYNRIFNSRFKNPLYRNLRYSDNLSLDKLSIAISSLVTKIAISYSKIENKNDKRLFAKAMNVPKLNNAISEYLLDGYEEDLLLCAEEIRNLLVILYEED